MVGAYVVNWSASKTADGLHLVVNWASTVRSRRMPRAPIFRIWMSAKIPLVCDRRVQ